MPRIQLRSQTTVPARLMTAEQFIRHIQTQFGIDLSKPYKGQTSALQRYLLPLGGVDHDTVFERDRQLKVQNLLAAQALAWEAATRIMEQEQKPKLARVFSQDKVEQLTPMSDRERWTERLTDFYLLLHNRLPKTTETQLFDQKVQGLLKVGSTPLQAWTAVVYALLASVEFWYL